MLVRHQIQNFENIWTNLQTKIMVFQIQMSRIRVSCCCNRWCSWCWLLIETFSLLLTCILYSSTCCCNWYNCWLSCWDTCSDCEVACRAFDERSKFLLKNVWKDSIKNFLNQVFVILSNILTWFYTVLMLKLQNAFLAVWLESLVKIEPYYSDVFFFALLIAR